MTDDLVKRLRDWPVTGITTHEAADRIGQLERERDYTEGTNEVLRGENQRLEATVATLTKKMEAMRGAAEEAAEVIHKAYVSATMEAVNAGPSHPLKDNIDKWRVRCLRAEEALRAALTTEKTND